MAFLKVLSALQLLTHACLVGRPGFCSPSREKKGSSVLSPPQAPREGFDCLLRSPTEFLPIPNGHKENLQEFPMSGKERVGWAVESPGTWPLSCSPAGLSFRMRGAEVGGQWANDGLFWEVHLPVDRPGSVTQRSSRRIPDGPIWESVFGAGWIRPNPNKRVIRVHAQLWSISEKLRTFL